MDEKLKNLWSSNKLLFLLLIPIIILVVFKDLIFAFLTSSVKNQIKNTIKDDDKAAKQQNDLANKAEVHEALADKLEEDIDNRDSSAMSEDWHLKRRN